MRRLTWLLALMAVVPAFLCGGPIYGVILFNSQALDSATISIACPGIPAATVLTLADGSYKVRVQGKGRCAFTVTSRRLSSPAHTNVVSSEDAAQYNFNVVPANGGYELQRSR